MANRSTLTLLHQGERLVAELPDLTLRVTSPGKPVQDIVLGMAPLVVGTGPDAAIAIEDDRVSRAHCEIRLGERGVVVRDLGSKNGTLIDEVPIVEAVLLPGASVRVGMSTLTLVAGDAPRTVPLHDTARFGDAVGASVVMRALFAELVRASTADVPILLLGESGTGKELLAHAVHANSARRDGPFVIVDCGAITPTLIESELFGHARGSFTGAAAPHTGLLEQAHEGTIVLDEIGELPLDLQPKLLRAIESKRVRPVGSSEWRAADARVVGATHRNLRTMVARGQFRQDLYYRLAVVEARVPPLREHKDDLPLLVEHLLAGHSPPRTLDDLPPRTLELLRAHEWPGNVRELRNVLHRLVIFPEQVDRAISAAVTSERGGQSLAHLAHLSWQDAREQAVAAFEQQYLTAVLKRADGRVAAAAEAMGVSRQFAYRLFARYDIRCGDE